jgi:hypothetical protein
MPILFTSVCHRNSSCQATSKLKGRKKEQDCTDSRTGETKFGSFLPPCEREQQVTITKFVAVHLRGGWSGGEGLTASALFEKKFSRFGTVKSNVKPTRSLRG